MNRARYHLYMNPTKSQKKMRLNPGPRMRRGEGELESTSPADFNVSNRSKIFSSLSNTLFDCSSLLNLLNESCLATDGVMTKEGCVRQLGGAKAVVDAKTRPSQHNRLKRSILCIDIVRRIGVLSSRRSRDAMSVCRGNTPNRGDGTMMRAEVPGGGKLNNSHVCSNLFPNVYEMYTSMYFWQSMDPVEQVRCGVASSKRCRPSRCLLKKQRVIFELLVVLYHTPYCSTWFACEAERPHYGYCLSLQVSKPFKSPRMSDL